MPVLPWCRTSTSRSKTTPRQHTEKGKGGGKGKGGEGGRKGEEIGREREGREKGKGK
jgi:hypothetical protein